MIELLLQAERALTTGMTDQAERLYWQAVEADAHNAIAVTGLARVALERADDRTAYVFARKALAIDPENPAAQRLVARLEEVMTYRGEAVPVVDPREPMPRAASAMESASVPAELDAGRGASDQAMTQLGERPEASTEIEHDRSADDRQRGIIGRIFRRGH